VKYPTGKQTWCEGRTGLFDATVEGGKQYEQEVADAKAVCQGVDDGGVPCPVLVSCRQWAIAHGVHGVWGGTDERDRRKARFHAGVRARSYDSGQSLRERARR